MARIVHALALGLSSVFALGHDHSAHGVAPLVQFHANQGQWPAEVLYRANTPGGAVFVNANAFTHVLMRGGERSVHGRPGAVAEPLRMHAYRMRFVGGDAQGHHGTETQRHYANYFLGDDPARWAGGVPVHGGVHLDDVYPGIDLRVSGESGMKYDWVVEAGSDASRIILQFEGHDGLDLEGDLLRIRTSAGDVIEQRPVAWQEVHGAQRAVPVRYTRKGDRVSYEFPQGFDVRYKLIIDPVVTFCSYSGSSADNFGTTATYDEQGHLYGAGTVFSIGYPTTLGVLQDTFTGTGTDMGISKFTPDGTDLVWSTYLGGSDSEVPHSMVVNSNGELYVLGTTGSEDHPTTDGCFDPTFEGGVTPPFTGSYGFTFFNGSDAVVAHLNNTATALIGCTFLGGSGNDGLNQSVPLLRNYGDPFRGEIILDAAEFPIIATTTESADLTTSTNAPQPVFGGALDAFVLRMNPTLSDLPWATYYGGSDLDVGLGVQVASNGEVYLTGGTQSTDLLMAGASFHGTNSGGVDGYIARFSPSGDQLLAATYLGTSGFDQSYFVQLDLDDEVYVVGQTTGAYPVSSGVYANPNASQFIHKLSTDLSTSIWSTRIGGTGTENVSPSAFLVSTCDQIYFSGWAGSTNPAGGGLSQSSTMGLPVSNGAFQPLTDGSDFYLIVLDPDAADLAYATFFGGTSAEHVDGGTSRFDKDGIVYQAVCAGCSGTFPTTPGAYSSTDMGVNCNLGVFKINFEQGVQAFIDADATDLLACIASPFVFNAEGNAVVYTWDFGDGSSQEEGATVAHIYASGGAYTVRLIGSDPGSCNGSDTAYVTVTVVEPSDIDPQFDAVVSSDCDGYSVELFNLSTGSTQFIWNFGDGSGSGQTNPVHAYQGPGQYEISLGVVDPVCVDTVFLSQTVVFDPAVIQFAPNSPLALCDGESVTADAGSGFDSYAWSTGGSGQQVIITEPGSYTITVTDGFCEATGTIEVYANPVHPPVPDVTTCITASVELVPGYPVQQIQWSTGEQSASISVSQQGLYWFDAIDAFGCPVTDSVLVLIAEEGRGEAFIPNVFTPNGDGDNDTFMVEGLAIDDFRMEVFNRWGQKMYESTSLQKGWNGGLDNATGNKVPDGTYYYIIDLHDRCSTEPATNRTGHVTLMR